MSRCLDLHLQLDVTDMKEDHPSKQGIPDASIDFALDKATLDSVLCHLEGKKMAAKALQEIDRVLKPDGIYMCLSRGVGGPQAPHHPPIQGAREACHSSPILLVLLSCAAQDHRKK